MNYFEMNRESWNQRAEIHFDSRFYDVDGFMAGNTSLREIELAELTQVDGRRLLHLQCHFGLDTLSWARLGAECTGVDISPVAINKARQLNDQAGLDAQFVSTDVYSYSRGDAAPFDIVFTSYGTICWLPDLDKWAEVVASNLAVGGIFYMAEFHPIYDLLAGYSYFEQDDPDVEEEATYTENSGDLKTPMAVWSHPMGKVVNALVNAGIAIQRLNEFSFSPYNCFKGMTEREPGRYYLSHNGQDVPLVYTITGQRVE
ncbi:class I SAM-dependent methyltransferase [Pseudomonadota bacterium]